MKILFPRVAIATTQSQSDFKRIQEICQNEIIRNLMILDLLRRYGKIRITFSVKAIQPFAWYPLANNLLEYDEG